MSESDRHPSSVDREAVPPERQPAYGRVARPEYGALASDFPASYNPYVYGEPERSADSGQKPPDNGFDVRNVPGRADVSGQSDPPRMFRGVNLDDPVQNPLYGHWDAYAIVAFVFSLSSLPLLPAIMGGIAMWRTRTFHMKGFGLALAAVLLNLVVTVMDVWMMAKGISMADLLQWMQGQSVGGGGQNSGMLST